MERCKWNKIENNPLYQEYHDNEWGVESHDEKYLFEMLILESFHCGLSWLLVLKKRESFRKAFDGFDVDKVAAYGEAKIATLLNDKAIIRNKAKILAAIANAQAFIKVQSEFDSFDKYIWSFTSGKVVYSDSEMSLDSGQPLALGQPLASGKPLNSGKPLSKNDLSDKVAKDLKKRGFKFMGSVTTYSFLEAIGVMNNHIRTCFRYKVHRTD